MCSGIVEKSKAELISAFLKTYLPDIRHYLIFDSNILFVCGNCEGVSQMLTALNTVGVLIDNYAIHISKQYGKELPDFGSYYTGGYYYQAAYFKICGWFN